MAASFVGGLLTNTQKGNFSNVKNNSKKSIFSGFRKGMLVNGVITQVSDKISINLNGVEVNVANSAIQDATEGETREFEIMDVSNNGIALKEVGNSKTSGNLTGVIQSTVIVNNQKAQMLLNNAEERAKEKQKEEQNQKTRDSADDVSSRMTGSDYGAIAGEGVSVEDMELNAFDAALERAKEKHSIERSMTSINHASNFIPEEFKSDARQSKIAAKLMMANLPATAANVAQVTKELDNLETINEMSDRTISYLIETGLEPTAENIYRGSYAGILSFNDVSPGLWQALEGQAKDVIAQAGLDEDEQNLKNAKWLLANELPLTKESIRMVADLQAARGNFDEDECTDRMIATMSKGFSAKTAVLLGGKTPDPYVNDLSSLSESASPRDININVSSIQQPIRAAIDTTGLTDSMAQILLGQAGQAELSAANGRTIANIPNIQDEAITKTIVENQEMTLGNLIKSQEEINSGDNVWRGISITPGNALAEIRAKRQLEEIRLKMTTEAGNRLAAKGIRLDTTGLQRVVQELRNLEQDYFKSYQNGTATAENLAEKMELFQRTTEAVFSLQSAPSFLLGKSVNNQDAASLTTLSNDAASVDMRRVRASGAYESLSTEVRKDLGDNIQKAFQNVDTILKDLNLESTQANERAVRILGYNNMEINEENINQMKQYDGEVNYTLSNLHPAVAISMIKQGINPLDTPIAELNDQIDKIREEEGITSEKKYTSYLWKLERSENFTKQEKSAFIGIYRLINAIKNSDGAAVGSVVNADQELTLHNLLQAVRTAQNGGIDEKVDPSTGLSGGGKTDSIVDQILDGYVGKKAPQKTDGDTAESTEQNTSESTATEAYADTMVKNILDTITPEKLNTIWKELDGTGAEDKMNQLLSMSLEKFAQEVNNAEQTPEEAQADSDYNNAAAQHIREILEGSDEAVEYLIERELPVSANMIDAVRQMGAGGRKFFEKLNNQSGQVGEDTAQALSEAADGIEEKFTDEASAKEAYQEFTDTAKQAVAAGYDDMSLTADDTWGLQSLTNMVNLVSTLAQRNEQYQIPVWTKDGSVTAVNLTLVRSAGEKGRVHVDVESASLGEIHADYKIAKGKISSFIVCTDRAGQDTMKAQERSMRQQFQLMGLSTGSINYAMQGAGRDYQSRVELSNPDSNVDTKVLYQVAKCVIETVKSAENA
jgi:hypothetical protein